MNMTLWNTLSELKSEKYKWVDLTHELSPETPHWYGFKPLEGTTAVRLRGRHPRGHDGSHALLPGTAWPASTAPTSTSPRHFRAKGRSMESEIDVTELVLPAGGGGQVRRVRREPRLHARRSRISRRLGKSRARPQIPAGSLRGLPQRLAQERNQPGQPRRERRSPTTPAGTSRPSSWLVEEPQHRRSIGHEPADTDPGHRHDQGGRLSLTPASSTSWR